MSETRNRFIRDPEWLAQGRNYKAQTWTVLRLMGFASGKLPTEGTLPCVVDGITVWIAPLGPKPENGRRRRKNHRVRAFCPSCGRELSAGRLHQHICKAGK